MLALGNENSNSKEEKHEDGVLQYENECGNDLNVFDIDCLKGITKLEIGNDCFMNITRFVIDGLNELRILIIGKKSFKLDKNSRTGSKCVIMNCDQLGEMKFGKWSFCWYETLELKNLRSIRSVKLCPWVFRYCHRIVFDSMND